MRILSRIMIVALAGMLVASATAGLTMTVRLSQSYGTQGEFLASPGGSAWLDDASMPFTPVSLGEVAGKFETFCVEQYEYFYWDRSYYVEISDAAVEGGVPGGSDPLNPQTAYLYDQFIEGTLSNYFTGDRNVQANALQQAIWYLEGEVASVSHPQAAWWVQEAVNASGVSFATYNPNPAAAEYLSWGDTIGSIRVMNLWQYDDGTGFVQDQLVKIPAPGAALLGVIGLSAVAWIRRRV